MSDKIKVLVVDDSALMRSLMTRIIQAQPDLELCATAPDPIIARDLIKRHNPHVITLDIEMPRMDGLEFLERLMRTRPTPVVMVSTLTERGADATFRALELGAVDFVSKPKIDISNTMEDYADEIAQKIRAAYAARNRLRRPPPPNELSKSSTPPSGHTAPAGDLGAGKPLALSAGFSTTEKLILIGSSTGGTEALRVLLDKMPKDSPAILITQHMPAGFTKSFANRLNSNCPMTIKEAIHGERVLPGHAYIAPGDQHLAVKRSGANFLCHLSRGEPVNRHRPSVEVLFRSGIDLGARNLIGVMLTGMGKDGAQAMAEMKSAGAYNICQDEATSVVFGMPGSAIALGAAHEVLPLPKISDSLVTYLNRTGGRAAVRV